VDIGCLIAQVLWVYSLIIFARIILSWITMFRSPPSFLSPIIRVVYDLTEPVMRLFRRYIPPIGGLDLSPIFIFLIISLIQGSIC
jgi:YggT family protein